MGSEMTTSHRLLCGVAAIGIASPISPGTPSQVAAAVKASISIQVIPSDLTPSLQAVSTQAANYNAAQIYMKGCDAYNSSSLQAHPAACFSGNLISKRTVILYGDSNAGNWAPAADLVGRSLGFRLALIAMSGCTAGIMSYPTKNLTGPQIQRVKNCEEWHSRLPALTKSLHPIAVLFVSAGWVWPTPVGWNAAVAKAFKVLSLGNPRAKRVVLGTTPDFNYVGGVPPCLASQPTSVQRCDVTYPTATSFYAEIQARDRTVATAVKAGLIPVAQWLCSSRRCSPIIKNFLVYVDDDHFSLTYGQWLAGVFGAALKKQGI